MNIFNHYLLVLIIFFSVFCSIQDIKNLAVSNWILLIANISVLFFQLFFNKNDILWVVLSGILYFVFYYLVRLFSKKKLGMADVYFGMLQGFCIRISLLPVCVLAECLFVGLLILIKPEFRTKKIPFIPFMAAALILTYLASFILPF